MYLTNVSYFVNILAVIVLAFFLIGGFSVGPHKLSLISSTQYVFCIYTLLNEGQL